MQARIVIDVEIDNPKHDIPLTIYIGDKGCTYFTDPAVDVSRFMVELMPKAISPAKLSRTIQKDPNDLESVDRDTMGVPQ